MADENLINNPAVTSSSIPSTATEGGPSTGLPASPNEPAPFSLAGGAGPQASQAISQTTPMELAAQAGGQTLPPGAASIDSIQKQIEATQTHFASSINTLQDPVYSQGGMLKGSTVDLLSQHLNNATSNLSSAMSRVGMPPIAPLQPPTTNQVAAAHLLDYLTGSQSQLVNMTQSLADKGQSLGPSDLLGVQVKMSGVQQQMELFTTLLGKATDNIKTIMNIQS